MAPIKPSDTSAAPNPIQAIDFMLCRCNSQNTDFVAKHGDFCHRSLIGGSNCFVQRRLLNHDFFDERTAQFLVQEVDHFPFGHHEFLFERAAVEFDPQLAVHLQSE